MKQVDFTHLVHIEMTLPLTSFENFLKNYISKPVTTLKDKINTINDNINYLKELQSNISKRFVLDIRNYFNKVTANEFLEVTYNLFNDKSSSQNNLTNVISDIELKSFIFPDLLKLETFEQKTKYVYTTLNTTIPLMIDYLDSLVINIKKFLQYKKYHTFIILNNNTIININEIEIQSKKDNLNYIIDKLVFQFGKDEILKRIKKLNLK